MLTRRGFASCALCAISGFIATEASAQGTSPAAAGGVTRKILSKTDGPAPGFETLLVEATIEAVVGAGRAPPPRLANAPVTQRGCATPLPKHKNPPHQPQQPPPRPPPTPPPPRQTATPTT